MGKTINRFYTYHINLNERGQFYADVRNERGSTVYEIMTDDDGTCWQFDDGIMRHVNDIDGLEKYLKTLGVIGTDSRIVTEESMARMRYMEVSL